MNTYLFTVQQDRDGRFVDWFADVTAVVGHTPESFETVCQVADTLEPGSGDSLRSKVQAASGIWLRARFTPGGGFYKIFTEESITRDDLDKVLMGKFINRELNEFLRSIKC